MPEGLLVTVPLPVPAFVMVRLLVGASAKVAVTDWLEVMLKLQVPVPLQDPLQPSKIDPAAGTALSVTCVPLSNIALQELPQLIPAGLLVTVPPPLPARLTVSTGATATAKFAVNVWLLSKVMTQAPVPVQIPLHPMKTEPAAGVAVSVILDPEGKSALQVFPQLMPEGMLVTVPEPLPVT